jgi:hypothetical protein
VRNSGVPKAGFTWYSLTDQVDWDTALRDENGIVNPLGLYHLDCNIHPVGRAYKHLDQDRCQVPPAQSVWLQLPIIAPRDFDKPSDQRARNSMKWICNHTPSEPLMPS